MSLPGLLNFVIYAVVIAVIAYVLIWLSDQFAPAALKRIFRAAIIVIAVLSVLIRLLLLTGTY